MAVEVLGRGIIIITGPLCQSGSGNLWVSVWERGWGQRVPSGAQNLPGTGDGQRQSAALLEQPPG